MTHSILDGTRHEAPEHPRRTATPVREAMSRPAVAVTPETDFATLVAAITASRRGVLPVLTRDGSVVGVVAASDLLAAYDAAEPGQTVTAGDLMTSPAITVAADQPVREAVRTIVRESVHHLPVVDPAGRLVGILSPHDLLDALRRADEAILEEVLGLALTPGSGVAPGSLHVRCERGTVVLSGRTRTRSDAAALCMAVSRIEQLAGLTDRLRWDLDDTVGQSDAAP